MQPCGGGRSKEVGRPTVDGSDRGLAEEVAPHAVEPRQRLVEGGTREAVARADQYAEAVELGERFVDRELDLDAERLLQPYLDTPFEHRLRRPLDRDVEEIIGEEGFLAFLVLDRADHGI